MKKIAPTKIAYGFGMVRTAMGYITKETLIFTLTDDAKKNKKVVDAFAKEYNLALVEVWYRWDNAWDTVKLHKVYTYHPDVNGATFEKMRR